jgi:hypothetical protein
MRQIATRRSEASLDKIEGVYRARAAQFERVAAAILRDREVARDVVQDAFATVVRKTRGFARRGSVDAWIWRTVVNTALTRLRGNRRQAKGRFAQGALVDDQPLDNPGDAGVLGEFARLRSRRRRSPASARPIATGIDATRRCSPCPSSMWATASSSPNSMRLLERECPRPESNQRTRFGRWSVGFVYTR